MTTEKNPAETAEEILETKKYETDRLSIEIKTFPKCRVNVIIDAKPTVVKEAKKKAVRNISKEVSIPGFRKGKAPESIIEKNYSTPLKQEWEKEFAHLTFNECQTKEHIPILHSDSKISYHVHSLSPEGGNISFQFEREPAVPEIAYADLPVHKVEVAEVTEKEINTTLHQVQMFYANWEEITDRGIEEGDFVILDIDDIEQDPPVQAFSHQRFEVREGQMAHWMKELLLGKKVDESVEGVSKADPNEPAEVQKEFKEKRVRIHIRTIEKPTLPPIDDDFAQKLGVPNVEALHIQLKNLLLRDKREKIQKELRDQVADYIIATSPFEIPASLLEKEANHRMSELFKSPEFSKKWKEEFSEAEKEEKKKEITTQAEHAIRLFYICRKIVLENKITISEEELNRSYDSLLEMMFSDPALFNYKHQSNEKKAIEYSRFMIRKAEDFIINKALEMKGN